MTSQSHQQAAEWMADTVRTMRELYQEDAACQIQRMFGDAFVYTNANGNLAIDRQVLARFRKLSGKDVVWVRAERYWRLREPCDDPGRSAE